MPSPPPSSSARAGGGGRRAWVLLDRTPRLTDLSDADVLVNLVPPPAISTAFLHRALLHGSGDDAATSCRVEGADASGHLLLGFTSPPAPGDSSLMVCRPVPTSTCEAAKGTARFLPAFPEDALGHAISPAAPTGIVSGDGDGYHVVQLHPSPSSSTPAVATALCFSNDDGAWSVREVVPADHRWHGFRATSVVSHDARLLFVDPRRGLLLFHPRLTGSDLFVDFPDPPEGAHARELHRGDGDGDGDATVDSSDGRIVYVAFYDAPEGTLVSLFCLGEQEQDRRWTRHFNVVYDEVYGCDHRVSSLLLGVVPSVGHVDPYAMNRIIFGARRPHDNGGTTYSSFCVEVTPAGMMLDRVRLCGDVERCASSDAVVWRLPDTAPKRSWADTLNTVGTMALTAVQKGREFADQLPAGVELVGGALGLPYTGSLVSAAKVIKKANDYFTVAENAASWMRQHRPGAPALIYRAVGSMEEAEEALKEWHGQNEPKNMTVDPAQHLTQRQWDEIKDFFVRS